MRIQPNKTYFNPSFNFESNNNLTQINKGAKKHTTQKKQTSNKGALPFNKALLYQKYNFHETKNEDFDDVIKTYDSFTGLRDKNYLLSYLNVAMDNAQRKNQPLSIAMFDMDDFKSVNELLGYETGDVFIKSISEDISKVTQENNVDVYRFGGEEFILVFEEKEDSEKVDIANAVVEKINENNSIQSYKNKYLRNAQARLDRALYSTSRIHDISELKTKKEMLEEVLENLVSPEVKNEPYFSTTLNEISSTINSKYRALIKECLFKEQNRRTKQKLVDIQNKLVLNEELTKTQQAMLDEYLYSIYDKSHEIHQTKRWIDTFKYNDGFGITCGVVNFEPESLEFKTPMDIIGRAGKALKSGKEKKKGQVYIETVQY